MKNGILKNLIIVILVLILVILILLEKANPEGGLELVKGLLGAA